MNFQTKRLLWGETAHTHSRTLRLTEVNDGPRRRSVTLFRDNIFRPSAPNQMLSIAFEDAIRRCPGVTTNSDILDGQPCIAGTRVPVRSVLRAIENSGTIQGAIVCYPHLTVDQVKDALYFSQLVLEWPSGADKVVDTDR